MQFRNFAEQLALHDLRVLKTFRRIAVEIHERGVVLENPALYFEIVDAPCERIGQRLVHKKREWLPVIIFSFHTVALAGLLLEDHLRWIVRGRRGGGADSNRAG